MGNWITALGLPEVFEGLLCCTSSTLSALCFSCTAGYPRFFFSLFLLFGTISSFLVLSPNMRSTLDKLPYFCTTVTTEEMCDNLVGYGAVYRICFSLAVFYGAFSLFMLNTNTSKDIRVKIHNGYWFLKLVLLVAILVGAFHIPRHTEFGRLWMYVGLTAGFIFIMIQILLVIDFAHSWSFSWAEKIESGSSNFWSFALVFSTIVIYSMAITMAVFYYLYFTDLQNLSRCRGNMFLVSFTVFQCLLASVISTLSRVQETSPGSGLLQSSVISLYTMYLTWCTLSSEPDGSCNPMGDVILEYDKVSGVNGQAVFDCVLMFALLIFACNVRTSTSKLEKIGFSLSKYPTSEEQFERSTTLNDTEKYAGEKNIENEEYVEYNYSFFHFVMFLASLQLMMVVTNWHSPDEFADLKKLVKNWATVWIQLSSSFLCVLFYIWATVTPLLVRTWGGCLGLDYESVPTEDDYDRARRRREAIRERREMKGYFKSSKIETNLMNSIEEGKNYRMQNDSDNFAQASEKNLRDFSLSSVKNQGRDEITQDSGMCDTTDFTHHSRSFTRSSAREHLSKSTVERLSPERRSKSALGSQTMYNEKSRTHSNDVEVNTSRLHSGILATDGEHSDGNVVSCSLQSVNSTTGKTDMERENSNLDLKTSSSNTREGKITPTTTLPRPQSVQLRLNKYTASGKQQKTNARPHSSMALTNKTLKEDNKFSTENHSMFRTALENKLKTCVPPLISQKKTFLHRKMEGNERDLLIEEDDNTEHSSSKNQRSTACQESDNELPHGELSRIDENKRPKCDLSAVGDPAALTDISNVTDSTKTPVLQNRTDLNNDQEAFDDRNLERNTNLIFAEDNDNASLEKSVTTPLKLQDHLKWARRLRNKKEKVVPSNTQDASKTEAFGERPIDRQKLSEENKAKLRGHHKEGSNEALINDSESFDGGHNNKISRKINNRSQETLDQSLTNEENKKTISSEFTHDQRTTCSTEMQTPDVAKEILRLQQKILKFQANVVKTQKRIFEMQQQDSN